MHVGIRLTHTFAGEVTQVDQRKLGHESPGSRNEKIINITLRPHRISIINQYNNHVSRSQNLLLR